MLGRWTESATDDEVLKYIEDYGSMVPHEAQAKMSFTGIDEVISLLSFVARSLQQQKSEFLREIQHDHSSSAHTCAQTFKILLELQADLLAIAKDYAIGRWPEKAIAELPSYPDNVR
jgi:hypothetical protein